MECFSIAPIIATCLLVGGLAVFGYFYRPPKEDPDYFSNSFEDIHNKISKLNVQSWLYIICYPAIVLILVPMGWPVRTFTLALLISLLVSWGQRAICP